MAGTTKPKLEGHRRFMWFEPQKRRPTEYESFTIGQQSSPDRWLDVGWPLCFDDGRPPFDEDSTALRCQRWEDFRDPAKVWQRPYVARVNREQQAQGTFVHEAVRNGGAASIAAPWRDNVLGKYYAAWPFVEYGQFLSLCYVVRETLAETLTFAFAFQATDKMRHQQDIVHLIIELQEALPGYSDEAARPAWMEDPVLVPLREMLERIYALDDWGEIVCAINLVLEPTVGSLAKDEFFSRSAPLNGDPVTPLLLATSRRDTRRHLDATVSMVKMVANDSEHGEKNREVVREWIAKWQKPAAEAARALEPLFNIDGVICAEAFDACHSRVEMRQRAILDELEL